MNPPIGLRTSSLAILLFLGWQTASAQHSTPEPMPSASDLRSLCERTECRRDIAVQIRLADGRVQEETAPLYRPAILPGSVSVLLGEELTVVPEFSRNEFQGWRAPGRREASRTPVLTVRLSQESDGSMSAAFSASGRDPVKVELFLRAPGSSQYEYTSTCPITPGATIFEYWNQAVVELQVRSARMVSDDAALMCD